MLKDLQQIADKIFLLWTLYKSRNYQALILSLVTTLIQYSGLMRKCIKRFRYPVRSNYFCLKDDQETIDEIIGMKIDGKAIIVEDFSNSDIKAFIANNFAGKGKNSRPYVPHSNPLRFENTARIYLKHAYIKIKNLEDDKAMRFEIKLYAKSTDYYNKITLPVDIPNNGKVKKIINSIRGTSIEIFPIKFSRNLYTCYDEIISLIDNWKINAEILKHLGGNKLSLVFEGPPGCGKTVLAHHLAFLAGLDTIVDGKYDSKNKFIDTGFSDKAVIIFDDLDVLWAFDRNADNEENKITRERKEALKCFMEYLDNQNSGNIIVFTTNFPDRFDEALFRPGRINRRIKFDRLTFDNCRKAAKEIYDDAGIIGDLAEMVEHDATSAELINLIKNNISDMGSFVREWNNYWGKN